MLLLIFGSAPGTLRVANLLLFFPPQEVRQAYKNQQGQYYYNWEQLLMLILAHRVDLQEELNQKAFDDLH